MNLGRTLGALGLAAVLAAGPALASPADAAAKPGYVAIVISGHGAFCVKWTSRITGDAVLNKVATVGYRNDGLIVSIDGDPGSGTADDTHFWSYWHDTSGSWTYSNSGASGYDPKAGSVEGWSYDSGQSSAPAPSQSPSGLYNSLCGGYDTAGSGATTKSSSAAPKHTATATRTATAPKHHPTRSRSGSASSRSATARRSASPTTSPTRSGQTSTSTSTGAASSRAESSGAESAGAESSAAPSSSSASTGTPSTSTGSSSSASSDGPSIAPGSLVADGRSPSASASSGHSSGSPVGLIVGIGLVLALGAGAGAVALRRRAAGG